MTEIKPLNLEKLISILKDYKKELKKRYGVKEIGVFGSFVRGEDKKKFREQILIDSYS